MKIKIGLPLFLFFAYSFLGFALGQEKLPSNKIDQIKPIKAQKIEKSEWAKKDILDLIQNKKSENQVNLDNQKFKRISEKEELLNNSISEYNSIKEYIKNKREDLSKRDAHSKHFINEDGSFTAIIGVAPIHYQNNGAWEDISTEVIKSMDSDFPYMNTKNLMKSFFGSSASKGIKSISDNGEIKEFLNLKLYWEVEGVQKEVKFGADVEPTIENDKVYYNHLFGDIDAEYIVYVSKRKLNYIVHNKESLGIVPDGAEYLVFSEDVLLPINWKYQATEKGIYIYNYKGDAEFLYEKPSVFENYSNNKNIPSQENPAQFQIEEINGGLRILLKVNASWLLANERNYPLAIDPTVSIYPNETSFWSGTDAESGVLFGSGNLLVGYLSNFELNGFLRIHLGSLPYGCEITAARTALYHMYANREGQINNQRRFVTGHSYVDPLTASNGQVFNGFDNNMTANATAIGNNTNSEYKFNIHNATGFAILENDMYNQGFTTLLAYPNGTWTSTNYAVFGGYFQNPNQTSYLEVTYNNPTTTGPCVPSTDSDTWTYIDEVHFFESLSPAFTNPSSYNGGYQNFSTLPTKAVQQQGGAINLFVSGATNEATSGGSPFGIIKAWVDWNNDGDFFDEGEEIYHSGMEIITSGALFGFHIPDTIAPGNYKLRVRNHKYYVYYYDVTQGGVLLNGYYSDDFTPCIDFIDYYESNGTTYEIYLSEEGEAEDYLFEVVAKCDANVIEIENYIGCNASEAELWVKGSSATTGFNWYTTPIGGSPVYTAANSNKEAIYNPSVPIAPGVYTFYVEAVNGAICHSLERTEITVTILSIPEVNFEIEEGEICGIDSTIKITSNAEKEVVHLIDEKFNSGLGSYFVNIKDDGTTTAINDLTKWQAETSVYVPQTPEYKINRPAFASGLAGNGFVLTNSDVFPGMPLLNHLESISLDTSDFLNLTLKFRIFCLISPNPNAYLKIETSIDGGLNWITAATISNTLFASPNKFGLATLNLDEYIGVSNLKIRFSSYSWADSSLSYVNITAMDDIELFGEKYVPANFNWSTDADLFNEDCLTAYSGASPTICLKPTTWQIENNEIIQVTATSLLSNGCSASGTFNIINNTKVWNTGNSDWASNNWKPSIAPPTADQCVYVRTPVTINTGLNGVAKSLVVENTGSLNINAGSSLTITNGIRNEASPSSFVVESDANLIQINPTVNIGAITVKRNATVPSTQYNYWASPVKDQVLYYLYPNLTAGKIMTYNTHDDFFTVVPAGSLSQFGEGYSIKGPSSGGPNVTANFVGIPQNESSISGENIIPLLGIGQGYNLIGNPYPSNLDLKLVYEANVNQFYDDEEDSPSFLFWDNTNNIHLTQQGSNYSGLNYAIYNPSSNMGNYAQDGNQSKKPNGIVKPGQGFLIRAKSTASGLVMNNTMRTTETFRSGVNAPYYKGEFDSNDKFWIDLVGPTGINTQMSVGYFVEASNAFERFDSPIIVENLSENIYSLSEDHKKLTIQGRKGPFNPDDEIPLVVKTYKEGNYQIELNEALGVFASEQAIYLKDKKAGIFHNLSQNPYRFYSTDNNLIENRFSIVFKQKTKVKFSEIFIGNKVEISSDKGQIYITSSLENIQEVEVYNLFGWRVYKKEAVSSKNFRIQENQLNHKVLVVRVKTESGEIYSEKIIN